MDDPLAKLIRETYHKYRLFNRDTPFKTVLDDLAKAAYKLGLEEGRKTQNTEVKNTINSKFLKEAKELEALWTKTGLLEGITEKYIRSSSSVLLEGQRRTAW